MRKGVEKVREQRREAMNNNKNTRGNEDGEIGGREKRKKKYLMKEKERLRNIIEGEKREKKETASGQKGN